MSSVGSFGTFTTARLGIYVAQKGLSVTGNNIANINTKGYTRQRLDQVSFKTGGADRYQDPTDMRVGMGAIAKSVSQLRDPYLDIRYRAEHSSEGFYNGRLDGLEQVKSILDEIGKGKNDGDGLLNAQFEDFFSALQHIQAGAGTEVNDTLASTSAEKLCQLFYNAASWLETLQTNTENQLRREVDDINGILTSIRKYNEAIQQAELYGDGALELRDERNNLIDELSEKLKIDATYSMVNVGGKQVEKLTIRLGNANPDKANQGDSAILVDGNFCVQLTTPQANEQYDEAYAVFDRDSAAYAQALKDLKAGKAVTDPEGGADFTTQADLDAAIDNALKDPAKALLPFRYVDENGNGTSDPREANQVFDERYSITLSDLRDENGKAWKDISDPTMAKLTPAQTVGFPTKAKYQANLTLAGVWKDGNKITVNGASIEIGKDVTADAANSEPKNISNAIRQALLKQPAFADYDISTTTVRAPDGTYNIALNITAKEAGVKTEPTIAIAVDAGNAPYTPGTLTLGGVTEETVATGAPKAWSVPVTCGDAWNAGDQIQVGGQTVLTVGQDISVNGAKNPARMASALARKLKLDGFQVSSSVDKDGNAKLVFTSTAADQTTATAPTLPTVNVEAPKKGSLTMGQPNWTPGTDAGVGADGNPVDVGVTSKTSDNGDGTISTETTRYFQDGDDWYRASIITRTNKTVELDDNDLYGRIQAVRELLTEEGEFSSAEDIDVDESAAIKRGIPYYREALDLLARKFATTMNEANNGFAVDQNGNYLNDQGEVLDLELAGQPVTKNTKLTEAQEQELIDGGCFKTDPAGNKVADLNRWLEAKGAEKMGGNLFSNRGDTDDDTGITALNISVSKSWNNGQVHVVPTYIKLFGGETSNTTQQDNALHMGNLIKRAMVYNPQDLVGDALSTHLFEGSFAEMFEKMNTTLGEDQDSTKVALQTHMGNALDIDTSRDSVSAVDLNDEAMDLMQYTHSLNAAYRLMTTLDEMLERLITGTGVTR